MFRPVCFLLFPVLLVGVAQAEELTFDFQRSEAEHWVLSSEHITVRDISGTNGLTESQTIQEIDERTELRDGVWVVIRTPRRAELYVDGVDMKSQALGLTVGIPITVTLQENGLASEVVGFRKLMRAMEDELPPAEFGRVSARYDAQRLAAGETASWNAPIEEFVGETVTIGERWRYTDTISIAGQKIRVTGVIRFDGWTELDGVRAFKVLLDYDSYGGVMRRMGEGTTRSLGAGEELTPPASSSLRLEGSDIRVFDPASGQMLYRSRGFTLKLSNPIEGDMPGAEGFFENTTVERWKRLED